MPTYKIQDSETGRILTVEGDSEPSPQDMEELFAANPQQPTSSAVMDALKRVPEGASVGVGQSLQGAARAGDIYQRNIPAGLRKVLEYGANPASPLFQMLGNAAPIVPGNLSTAPLSVYGKEYVEQPAEQTYGVDRLRDQTLLGQAGSSLGQMLPTIATGVLAGPAAIPAAMGQYGLASGEQQAQEAEQMMPGKQGVSDRAFLGGAASGALSEGALGVAGRLGKIALRGSRVPAALAGVAARSPVVARGIEGFAREGSQEALEQLGQNYVASGVAGYDPNRPATQGVGTAALLGGLLGGPLSAAAQAISPQPQQPAVTPKAEDLPLDQQTVLTRPPQESETEFTSASKELDALGASDLSAPNLDAGLQQAVPVAVSESPVDAAIATGPREVSGELVTPAIWVGDRFFTANSHPEAIDKATQESLNDSALGDALTDFVINPNPEDQGFIVRDKNGRKRFASRAEAATIFEKATGKKPAKEGMLTSEDMRDAGLFQKPTETAPVLQTPEAVKERHAETFTAPTYGQLPVEVQRPDGTTYGAVFNGWQEWSNKEGGLSAYPSIGTRQGNSWSHGSLKPGEKVLSPIPTQEQWKEMRAKSTFPNLEEWAASQNQTEPTAKAPAKDWIEESLQAAIAALRTKSGVMEGVLGSPVWVTQAAARAALQAALVIYRTTKNVARAISEGLRILREESGDKFNEAEARAWLSQEISPEIEPARLLDRLETLEEAGSITDDQAEQLKQLRATQSLIQSYKDTSKSALGEYEYLREAPKGESSNKRQHEYAKALADHYGDNFEAAINEASQIDIPSFRLVAMAEIQARVAQSMGKPGSANFMAMQPILSRLSAEMKLNNTALGQGLQATVVQNRILREHAPLLAWLELLKERQKKAVDEKLGPQAVDQVRKALNEASQQADGVLKPEEERIVTAVSKVVPKKPDQSNAEHAAEVAEVVKEAKKRKTLPERQAEQILSQFAKTQTDTPTWTKAQENLIRKIFNAYLKWNETPASFRTKMEEAGLGESLTERLLNVANREQQIKRAVERIKAEEKFTKWLNDDGAVQSLLKKASAKLGQNWRDLFRDLPENQIERRAKIMERARQDPRFVGLTASAQNALVKALDAAWEKQRLEIFRAEFRRLVPLPTVSEETRAKVEDSIPEMFKMANQGLLGNESFRNALAQKLGIEGFDGPTARKVAELGEKAQKAPEGVVRNKFLSEAQKAIEESSSIDVADLAKSFWYANVLSGTGTATTILSGGGMFGAVNTLGSALDAATFLKRPDVGLRILADFVTSIPEGLSNFKDILRTGDYTRIPGFQDQIKDSLESRFRSNSLEKLWRSENKAKKAVGSLVVIPRLLTGLDHVFSPGVRNSAALYAALSRKDLESLGVLMEKSDKAKTAAAKARAIEEFKAAGESKPKPVDVLARQREILEDGVNQEIKDGAQELAREANLNAKPVGFGGWLYDWLTRIPFVARVPLGATFLRAAINLMQNSANWLPGSGLVNYARSSPGFRERLERAGAGEGTLDLLAPELAPEQRRMIMIKQLAGLSVVLLTAQKFLLRDHDDDEWEITGRWTGLTPNQMKSLRQAGITPNSFWKVDKKTGKMMVRSFQEWPMAAPLAMIANMRDAQIYRAEEWNSQSMLSKIVNGWLMGLGYVTELPMLKQASDLLGTSAEERGMEPEKVAQAFARKAQNVAGSVASGAVPFASLQKDIDTWLDPKSYKPDNQHPGFGVFLRNLPFARRLSAEEPALNILGEPITQQRGFMSRSIRSQDNSPEMNALVDKLAQGVFPSWPGRTSKVVDSSGNEREMTEKEWRQYASDHGKSLKRYLAANLEDLKRREPQDKLKEKIMKGEAEKMKAMTPPQRLERQREINRFVNKESADGWLRNANIGIGNEIRKRMGFNLEPVEVE